MTTKGDIFDRVIRLDSAALGFEQTSRATVFCQHTS